MKLLKDWDKLQNGFVFRQLYPSGWGTLSGKPHLGLDKIAPCWTPIFMPFIGQANASFGSQSGNMMTIKPDNQNVIIRVMHMAKAGVSRRYNEGEIIGYVGTTGASTGCHLHCDISKGYVDISNINNFINPATFAWEEGEEMGMTEAQYKYFYDQNINRINAITQLRNDATITDNLLKGKVAELDKKIDTGIAEVKNLIIAQKVGLSTEDAEALSKWRMVWETVKNLFKLK